MAAGFAPFSVPGDGVHRLKKRRQLCPPSEQAVVEPCTPGDGSNEPFDRGNSPAISSSIDLEPLPLGCALLGSLPETIKVASTTLNNFSIAPAPLYSLFEPGDATVLPLFNINTINCSGMSLGDSQVLEMLREDPNDSDDSLLATMLQEEADEQVRVRLEAIQKKETEMMMATSLGRAWIVADGVQRKIEFLCSQVDGECKISPIEWNDMLFVTQRLIETQERFKRAGKANLVDIGYHYTQEMCMKRIQTDGLMTKQERADHNVRVPRENGSAFGDGIYTSNNPLSFCKFGPVGLLVARLQGNVKRVERRDSRNIPDGNFDTIIGNKRGSNKEFDEVVLQTSSQCVPLLRYSRDLVLSSRRNLGSNKGTQIDKFHAEMQELMDRLLNNNSVTITESLDLKSVDQRYERASLEALPHQQVLPPQPQQHHHYQQQQQHHLMVPPTPTRVNTDSVATAHGDLKPAAAMKQSPTAPNPIKGRTNQRPVTGSKAKPPASSAATVEPIPTTQPTQASPFGNNSTNNKRKRREDSEAASSLNVAGNPSKQASVKGLSGIQDATKREKECFLMFVRVLMKYLEQRNPDMHKEAKGIITDCAERNKKQEKGYENVLDNMRSRLKALVGDYDWDRAGAYLKEFLQQRGQKVPSLPGVFSPLPGVGGASKSQNQQAVVHPSPPLRARAISPIPTANKLKDPPPVPHDSVPNTQKIVYKAPDTLDCNLKSCTAPTKVHPQVTEECSICLEPLLSRTDPCCQVRVCGHLFHEKCLEGSVQRAGKRCPLCRVNMEEPQGTSPSGTMTIVWETNASCDGYPAIAIRYDLRSGIQKTYHENPGERFRRTSRAAYLPNSPEGTKLLKRLVYAFQRGLTFRVGTSLTTGAKNSITWASIHHKTSLKGGVHGFPDKDYFKNCHLELDNLGVPRDPPT